VPISQSRQIFSGIPKDCLYGGSIQPEVNHGEWKKFNYTRLINLEVSRPTRPRTYDSSLCEWLNVCYQPRNNNNNNNSTQNR